jgi:hypothetical protein
MLIATLILRATEPARLIAWCVIGILGGLYLFYKGFILLQQRRLILDTPVSKIRSAPMGMVEVSGLAVGPYTVISPITARSCYYFRTLVWELKQCGRSRQWVKVASECMHVPFFVEDNTGKVMVDPRGAELDLHCDFKQEFCDSFFTTKEKIPVSVQVLLSRHGVNTTNKIKVEEFCVKPKNALFVIGTLGDNPGIELTAQPIRDEDSNSLAFGKSLWASSTLGSQSFRSFRAEPSASQEPSIGQRLFGGIAAGQFDMPEGADAASAEEASAAPHVIRLSANPGSTMVADMTQQEKIAAALMKAGITNPAAWAASGAMSDRSGGEQVEETANALIPSSNGFERRPAVVLMKGKNNQTFLISWRSQREVANSLGWKCALMIWGGPALTLLCLYGLLALTHAL